MSFQIHIHTPGQNSKEVQNMISDYEKRISRYARLNWSITKTGTKEKENEDLKRSISGRKYIVLDERGKNVTTIEIADTFSRTMQSGMPELHIVIGGAYGLDNEIISGSSAAWAFGHITLPHQLVRLITTEQVYRALAVINNHPYHHS